MELTCPKCHGAMRSYERSGILIDQCTECRGVFLDRGELDKLIDAEAQQQPAAAAPAQVAPTQNPAWGSPQSRGYEGYRDDDRYRDDRYREGYLDDDGYRDDRYRYGDDHRYGKKRKRSFLEDLFD
jgi:Zn-finger nucleic acid-binding protein